MTHSRKFLLKVDDCSSLRLQVTIDRPKTQCERDIFWDLKVARYNRPLTSIESGGLNDLSSLFSGLSFTELLCITVSELHSGLGQFLVRV